MITFWFKKTLIVLRVLNIK